MTDLTMGTSAVLGADGVYEDGIAGAAITINQAVYRDDTVSPATWKLTDGDALGTASGTIGVALNTAPSGGHVRVALGGTLTASGATIAVGLAYYVSLAAGGICPEADITTGDFPVFLGFGKTATALLLRPLALGIAKA